MRFLEDLQKLKQLLEEGKNVIDYLNVQSNEKANSTEAIMISYDLQAGSYVSNDKKSPEKKENYTNALAEVIQKLDHRDAHTILEVGVGEATTLANLIPKLPKNLDRALGFDVSWSRIKYAQTYCKHKNVTNTLLFVGDLFNAPIQDNAIDFVYTLHSIEPNGGKEKEALKELYRITNKYLILLEPSYELASPEGKRRMEKLGYVKNLLSTAKELGYHIIEHRLFDYSVNPLNPTGLIIIEKNSKSTSKDSVLACPVTKKELKLIRNSYFCEDSLLAYPIIDNIPCLLPHNAVIATHYMDNPDELL